MIFKVNSENKILSSWIILQPNEPITRSYQYFITFTNSNIELNISIDLII